MTAAARGAFTRRSGLAAELLHFSAKPVVFLHPVEQDPRPAYKPLGLWVSVGSSWLEWCEAEQFSTQRYDYVTRVVLADTANVLRLHSAHGLDQFTRQFAVWDEWQEQRDERNASIDWWRVAEQYDGIVIAPYCFARRMKLRWYYGWDCASGCIWDARAVASFESVPLTQFAEAGR